MPKQSPQRFVMVLTTCGTLQETNRIARRVVALRLAACVNVPTAPVRSVYRWKGKIEQSREFLLVIKTARRKLTALRTEIERLHTYDVPEFLVLPVAGGSPAYLAWLEACLRSEGIKSRRKTHH